jgi:hypothetical protein
MKRFFKILGEKNNNMQFYSTDVFSFSCGKHSIDSLDGGDDDDNNDSRNILTLGFVSVELEVPAHT